jgi:hypothetical protein
VFVTAAAVAPFVPGCAGSDPADRPSRSTGGTGAAGSSKSNGASSSGPTGSSGSSRSTGSSGSTGSTGAASPSIKVTCGWRQAPHVSDQADCECRSEGGVGDKFEVSGGCWEHPDDPTISCADPDFPRSGSCFYWVLYPWRCSNASTGSTCACSFKSFQTGASALYCNAQEFSGSTYCCLSGQNCWCQSGTSACSFGEQSVSDCASAADALGLPRPPTSCPAGQIQVVSCNISTAGVPPPDAPSLQDTTPTKTDDCPGSCTIDDFSACCPERQSDGTCGTYCCDSAGCY